MRNGKSMSPQSARWVGILWRAMVRGLHEFEVCGVGHFKTVEEESVQIDAAFGMFVGQSAEALTADHKTRPITRQHRMSASLMEKWNKTFV